MPTIQLTGPLGSGVPEGASKGPTWAALALEQQEAQRRNALAEAALAEGQRQMQGEQATASAIAELAGLGTQARATGPMLQGLGAGLGAAGLPGPKPQSPGMLYERGAQAILKRAAESGSDPRMLRMLAADALEVQQQIAVEEDRGRIAQRFEELAQIDPDFAPHLQRYAPLLQSPDVDPVKVLQVAQEDYAEAAKQKERVQREMATSALADNYIAAIGDQTTPFGQMVAIMDPLGEHGLRDKIVSLLISKKIENAWGGEQLRNLETVRLERERQEYTRTLAAREAERKARGLGSQAGPQEIEQLARIAKAGDAEAYNAKLQELGLDPADAELAKQVHEATTRAATKFDPRVDSEKLRAEMEGIIAKEPKKRGRSVSLDTLLGTERAQVPESERAALEEFIRGKP